LATDDDASCLDPICIDPEACNYTEFSGNDYCLIVQPYQVHEGMVGDQDLTGYVTYRIYIKTQNNDDFVSSVSGDNEFPTRIMTSGSFLQSPFGGLLGSDQNPSLFGFFPAAEYDSYVTIGLTEGAGPGEGVINTIEDTGNPWGFNFEAGQDLLIDDAIGGGWFIFNGQSNGVAGDDSQVLLAQDPYTFRHSSTDLQQTKSERSSTSKRLASLQVDPKCVSSLNQDTIAMANASLTPMPMESAMSSKSRDAPMKRPATTALKPRTITVLASSLKMDTTAMANASLIPTKTVYAMSLKSRDVPIKQHATTTPKQPMKPNATTQKTDTTAKDSASLMPMVTESAMSSKSKDVSIPRPATTSIQTSSQTL
jgi:hypothetical protein